MTNTELLGTKTTVVKIPFRFLGSYTLGTHKNVASLQKALTDAGCKICDWGNDILNQPAFTLAQQEEEVLLVDISQAESGFPDGTSYRNFCESVLGTEMDIDGTAYVVDIPPNEVGPVLCLEYKDQPKGEWLLIAMEPITASDGRLARFRVAHDDSDLWLYADFGHPDHVWYGNSRFVFRLRKKVLRTE